MRLWVWVNYCTPAKTYRPHNRGDLLCGARYDCVGYARMRLKAAQGKPIFERLMRGGEHDVGETLYVFISCVKMTLCLLHHIQYNYFHERDLLSKKEESIPLSNSIRNCDFAYLLITSHFLSLPLTMCKDLHSSKKDSVFSSIPSISTIRPDFELFSSLTQFFQFLLPEQISTIRSSSHSYCSKGAFSCFTHC